MTNWGEIPEEISRKIAIEYLESVEDFEAFRNVCSSWSRSIKDVNNFCPSKNTQLPWLMLADPPNISHRRLYSLSKHMFRKINLPEPHDEPRMFFSSNGWLISTSLINQEITLYDPFSSKVVKPPSILPKLLHFYEDELTDEIISLFVYHKFIISSRPSSGDDFVVAVMFDKVRRLAFWRPGQHEWIIPDVHFTVLQVFEVCYFKGEFYALDLLGKVMAFGSEVMKRQPRVVVANLGAPPLDNPLIVYVIPYLVQVENTLLAIYRMICNFNEDPDSYEYYTHSFEIFELNVYDGKFKQVESVGEHAIFLGFNSSFSVDASSYKHGCKSNCIYFTDDYREGFRASQTFKGGLDMGIYSLKERKTIEKLYQGPSQLCDITPPMWVERPHFKKLKI